MSEPGRAVRVPAPAWLAADARRFAESGAHPVTPRTAATVILLRTSSVSATEVYVQRRAATMAFAPSLYAFPGGSVDARDAEVDLPWSGPEPAWWAARLGLSESGARGVVCAAVREVFEECGVLLAGPDGSTVVGDVSGSGWEAARVALLAREHSLAELLTARALCLRSDLLAPWARWLTPEFEPRRFDTYFFVARLPAQQRTREVGGESEHAVWLSLDATAQLPMLPPTRHTLSQIEGHQDIDQMLAAGAGHDLTSPIHPYLTVDDGGAWLVLDRPDAGSTDAGSTDDGDTTNR